MQAGFEDLLNGMAEEMGKTGGLENFLERMTAAGAGPSAAEPPTTTAKGPSGAAPPPPSAEPADPAMDASFQETIRRTMERMQTSGEQATAAASTSGGDDFMSEMLKQLSSGDFNAEGSEEEFSKMLMGMMEQLTNKEILYEPMKELNDKFPAWLEKNKDSTPAEDLKRYEEQKAVVAEIVAKFEESTYADSNTADREYIVDRMQKVSSRLVFTTTTTAANDIRCKPLGHRHQIWLEIWIPHTRPLTRRMNNAIPSSCAFGHLHDTIYPCVLSLYKFKNNRLLMADECQRPKRHAAKDI